MVTININYAVGFIMVYGDRFKKWINAEFPKVVNEYKELFEDTIRIRMNVRLERRKCFKTRL